MPDLACPRFIDVASVPAGAPQPGRTALFLDRDGVVNVDVGYAHRPEQVTFVSGVLELAADATRRGQRVVIITNQAGIARGFYGEAELAALTQWMAARFAEAGARLDRLYFCPHHPQGRIAALAHGCDCRKPGPGMLRAACRDLGLDAEASAFIGDYESDMQAGAAAGVGTLLMLAGPEGERPLAPGLQPRVRRVATLGEAARALGRADRVIR